MTKMTHTIDGEDVTAPLARFGRKNRSGRCAPGMVRAATGRRGVGPDQHETAAAAVHQGDGDGRGDASSGSDVMRRKAGGTTAGPVRRRTRRCWWNSPMESLDRRSNLRRRRLGTRTAAQTKPSIRRTTIVKNPSIYLPTCDNATKPVTTTGGWSGTVRAPDAVERLRPGARGGRAPSPVTPPSTRPARALPPPRRSTVTGTSKQAETAAEVSTSPAGPGRHDATAAHEGDMGDARGDLLDVVGDEHEGPVSGSAAKAAMRATRRSRAPRSSPAAGSSRRRSSGSPMSARARSTCWRSPSDRTPNSWSATRRQARLGQQRVGTGVVVGLVVVPPRLERGVAAGEHDVVGR